VRIHQFQVESLIGAIPDRSTTDRTSNGLSESQLSRPAYKSVDRREVARVLPRDLYWQRAVNGSARTRLAYQVGKELGDGDG
jgi:hypothetical protein